jgi:hypothetical protein
MKVYATFFVFKECIFLFQSKKLSVTRWLDNISFGMRRQILEK